VVDLLNTGQDRFLEIGEAALRDYWAGGAPTLSSCFFVAWRLRRAIRDGDPSVCREREFIYPIHQFLSGGIRGEEAPSRSAAIATLRGWLRSRAGVHARARDFAAFELGMDSSATSCNAGAAGSRNHGRCSDQAHGPRRSHPAAERNVPEREADGHSPDLVKPGPGGELIRPHGMP
jgi:hypothetical protein